jgi:hypothetical protein
LEVAWSVLLANVWGELNKQRGFWKSTKRRNLLLLLRVVAW